MKPIIHIAVSLSMGIAVWLVAKSLSAGVVGFIAGIFLDSDHIIEYIIHRGLRGITIKKIYLACEQTTRQEGEYRFSKLYLIFHSGEVAILLWIASLYIEYIYLIAIAFAYSVHMVMDCIANPMYIYSYFIIWRIITSFDPTRLFRKNRKK